MRNITYCAYVFVRLYLIIQSFYRKIQNSRRLQLVQHPRSSHGAYICHLYCIVSVTGADDDDDASVSSLTVKHLRNHSGLSTPASVIKHIVTVSGPLYSHFSENHPYPPDGLVLTPRRLHQVNKQTPCACRASEIRCPNRGTSVHAAIPKHLGELNAPKTCT